MFPIIIDQGKDMTEFFEKSLWMIIGSFLLLGTAICEPLRGQDAEELKRPLMDYVPGDASLVLEIRNLGQILEDIDRSGLRTRAESLPVYQAWLEGNQGAPLVKLRRLIEREAGQPLDQLLSDLFDEQAVVFGRRPEEITVGDDRAEWALLLRPKDNKTLDTAFLLLSYSQKKQFVYAFLGDVIVIASQQSVLEEVTRLVEQNGQRVQQEGSPLISRESVSRGPKEGAGMAVVIDYEHWLSPQEREQDEFARHFFHQYRQGKLTMTFEQGLDVSFNHFAQRPDEHQYAWVRGLDSSSMVSGCGQVWPLRVMRQIDQIIEDSDRKDWDQLIVMTRQMGGGAQSAVWSSLDRPFEWQIDATLLPDPANSKNPNAINNADLRKIARPLVDARLEVRVPEGQTLLKSYLESVGDATVHLLAIVAIHESKMRPSVQLELSGGASAESYKTMWLDSLWGMKPGYSMSEVGLSLQTMTRDSQLTERGHADEHLRVKADLGENSNWGQVRVDCVLLRDFLTMYYEISQEDSIAVTIGGRAAGARRESAMTIDEKLIGLVRMLSLFDEVNIGTKAVPGAWQMRATALTRKPANVE